MTCQKISQAHLFNVSPGSWIKVTSSCDVIHASMPRKLDRNRACGRVFISGLPTHLVQESNVGTVAYQMRSLKIELYYSTQQRRHCQSSIGISQTLCRSLVHYEWVRYYLIYADKICTSFSQMAGNCTWILLYKSSRLYNNIPRNSWVFGTIRQSVFYSQQPPFGKCSHLKWGQLENISCIL